MRGVHSLDPFDPFDRAIGVLMVPRMQTVLLACLLPWAAPSPDRRPDLFAWERNYGIGLKHVLRLAVQKRPRRLRRPVADVAVPCHLRGVPTAPACRELRHRPGRGETPAPTATACATGSQAAARRPRPADDRHRDEPHRVPLRRPAHCPARRTARRTARQELAVPTPAGP